ncbi:hypothetical protein BKA01_007837 [Pseudonocardia eucalypti]|nr:hypothetical protein [Pseudonocardia eucalypti]
MIAPSSPKTCPATATSTMATSGQIQIDTCRALVDISRHDSMQMTADKNDVTSYDFRRSGGT